MVELKFHCCMPIFVARQWIRHRTANVNELSGRYSLIPMLFYSPPPEQLQTQSRKNNQGRSGDALDPVMAAEAERRWQEIRAGASSAYEWLTGQEVARELARIDLPLSTYTQWYWKIDLHNLLHFLSLRVDRHAQWEIRVFGQVMAGMLKRVAPLSYEAWIDYDVCGGHLSRHELEILRGAITPDDQGGLRVREGVLARETLLEKGLSGRELDELLAKLRPAEVPDFELDLSTAKTAEYFAERFAKAVPGADRAPPEG
jgi:thymidylate synthase (FAD)